MKTVRITVAIAGVLLAIVGCSWLFVLHPVIPIALLGIVSLIAYFHGPEIIDLILRHKNRGGE